MTTRRRRQRAQAATEFALLAPLLVLMAVGTYDLGRAYRYAVGVIAQARGGDRVGIRSSGEDIGAGVRKEPEAIVPDDVAHWGPELAQPGSLSCDSNSSGCGDSVGQCLPSSSQWALHSTQVACFAVETLKCTQVSGGGGCQNWASLGWGYRPPDGWQASTPNLCDGASNGQLPCMLHVRVVYKFKAATPLLGNIIGHGGSLYVTRDAYSYIAYP